MGLSGHLQDVSTAAPLPLLALAALASAVSNLFAATAASSTSALSSLGSGFAALVALADHLAASPRASAGAGAGAGDCAVCLAAMSEGERVRALACRHAFHAACLDGWFDERRVSCPLCRAAPPLPEDVGRRAGEAAAAWFSRF